MKQIITDPSQRCMYCKGRKVMEFEDDKLIKDNLDNHTIKGETFFFCKDKKGCEQNVLAENTLVDFYSGDEKGKITNVEITAPNGSKIEVDFDGLQRRR